MVTKTIVLLFALAFPSQRERTMSANEGEKHLYEFTMKTIDGKDRPLADYRGKVLLIVNVASKCGYTPQYEGLEKLYRTYKAKGFEILGFPANNFMSQEPGTDAEIKEFCSLTYDVTFDLFSKISVKGEDQHPLYRYITSYPGVTGSVRWNFQKYLVDRNGTIVEKYSSGTEPDDEELVSKVEALLASDK